MTVKSSGLRRLLSLMTALIMVIALLPAQAQAASKPAVYSKMSSSYKSSVYYQRLMNVSLTGNQITDLLSVAVSQLGYHESNSKSDLSGAGKGTGNCTEYGNFTSTNGKAWCASFVSWCFREAGIPTSIVPTAARVCNVVRPAVYNKGAKWHSVDSGYKPKTGDLCIYESMGGNYTYYQYSKRDANGMPMLSSHISIVVSDFDEKTQTYAVIDGNGNQGCVKYLANQKLYMPGSTKDGKNINRIQGFVTPAYTSGPTGGYYNGSKIVVPDATSGVTLGLPQQSDTSAQEQMFIGTTYALLACRLDKPSSSVLESMKATIYDNGGTNPVSSYSFTYEDDTTSMRTATTRFGYWNTETHLGVKLRENTTYWYQFTAVVNGTAVSSPLYSFTTKGTTGGGSSTVRFLAGEGQEEFLSKSVANGSPIGELPSAEREGYTFLGWSRSDTTDPQQADFISSEYIVTGPETFYAVWSLGESVELDEITESSAASGVSLTLADGGDGQPVKLSADSRTLRCDVAKPAGSEVSSVSINIYTQDGVRITGYSSDFTGDTKVAGMSEVRFSAILGSEVLPSLYYNTVYDYDFNLTISDEVHLSDRGEFIFVSQGSSEGTPGTSSNPSTQTTKPAAPETPSGTSPGTYNIDFYNMNTLTRLATVAQTNGQKYILPDKEPTLSGYAFGGWYSNGIRLTENMTVDLSQDKTAYARWIPLSSSARAFSDVGSSQYYYSPVGWAIDKGITVGTSPTAFSPNETCTRGQIITFLWRAAGSPKPKSSTAGFSDVPAGQYYTDACLWAREQGMASGSTFRPNSPCTRAMAVEFIWKYKGSPSAVVKANFNDVSSGASYADAVSWAYQQGVTDGTSSTTFSPSESCTRGQIVTFLWRALA